MTEQPVVSVVVPMLNESSYIDACLDSFARQSYPKDRLEVLVVDGGSTDGSRQRVDERARCEPWIRVVENPDRRASSAFNRGVEAATGEVLCLFSAHGVADVEYVAGSVEALRSSGAAGVGGRYEHEGLEPRSAAIGLGMVSPFGMASPHRFASEVTDVDTISHPAYRRAVMLEVGPFDESLLRNSDYEFNHRVRRAGYRLVFDPAIRSVYRPRRSLVALGRQFWWYGRWKARVVALHPESMRARHAAPPAAVVAGALLVLASPTAAGRRALTGAAAAYGAGVAIAVAAAKPRRHGASASVLAATFPVMHATWGAGFLTSVVEDRLRARAR